MEKPAATEFPIHELLARRWSPRAFSARPVEREKLLALFEAARWAPSSFGDEPWSYLVARQQEDREAFDRVLSCLVEGNRAWAQHAPVLALSVARLAFAYNGQPNRHALHDVGAASMSLCVQATALGLFVHQMAGFDGPRARQLFNIPEGFDPAAAIAIGYPAEASDFERLPEKLRQREAAPRSRKPVAEFLFTSAWGHRAGIL